MIYCYGREEKTKEESVKEMRVDSEYADVDVQWCKKCQFGGSH